MVADGNTPFCVGLGSDAATGWPMTDWIEDYMLRLKGPEVYDQWYNHEIPFDDPDVGRGRRVRLRPVVDRGLRVRRPAERGGHAVRRGGLPLLEGNCEMYRMGNFYAANWPEGTELGPDGDVNAFYLPGSEEDPNITLSGGIYAAAFADRPR